MIGTLLMRVIMHLSGPWSAVYQFQKVLQYPIHTKVSLLPK